MRKLIVAVFMIGLCSSLQAKAQNFDSMKDASASQPEAATQLSHKQTGDCGDDPRLETELLNIMQSSTPINPPITVTPETFLNMDSEILQVLGGQMIICPNIPVLKSGRPMKKVPADFEGIWDNLRKAAIAGDESRMKQILTGFTAKPKTTREIVNMLSPVDLDDTTRKTLYNSAGIELPKNAKDSLIIDFYKALGGKTDDKTFVLIHANYKFPKRENYEQELGQYIDLPAHPDNMNFWTRKLRMVGVNAVNE